MGLVGWVGSDLRRGRQIERTVALRKGKGSGPTISSLPVLFLPGMNYRRVPNTLPRCQQPHPGSWSSLQGQMAAQNRYLNSPENLPIAQDTPTAFLLSSCPTPFGRDTTPGNQTAPQSSKVIAPRRATNVVSSSEAAMTTKDNWCSMALFLSSASFPLLGISQNGKTPALIEPQSLRSCHGETRACPGRF